MRVTLEMIEAARRAEYDFYQRSRRLPVSRFIPIPDEVIKAMFEAAFALVPDDTTGGGRAPAIIMARKPRPKR